ncbi:MAG TPA: NADP-dependent oxidoreductase [Firmicutes bacterium]|nr:NADP-dependent oxidoreductase [Bacillota bacterium]
MKAVQMDHYNKQRRIVLRDVPIPTPTGTQVLIWVKAAAVNPLDLLTLSGEVRLLQPASLPVTLGNECAGVIVQTGRQVSNFQPGDRVYTRLPVGQGGAFAGYVAVDQNAVANMPAGYDFPTAAALPLAGLTAYQGLTEELNVQPGQTLLLPGGSGSLGQVAVPIAKALGLRVLVTGSGQARDRLLALGADGHLDYRRENYWETWSGVDCAMDTLGPGEFAHELSVLKPGGRLLSLRTGPNRAFARRHRVSPLKRGLFTLAGLRYGHAAHKQGKTYRFLFVRADGAQLRAVTKIVEEHAIRPQVDERVFSLAQAGEALQLVAQGGAHGKIILQPEQEDIK